MQHINIKIKSEDNSIWLSSFFSIKLAFLPKLSCGKLPDILIHFFFIIMLLHP